MKDLRRRSRGGSSSSRNLRLYDHDA
jgi:hypothetical protein